LTFVGPYNTATSTAAGVTIEGINMGPSDTTPTVRLGTTQCTTAVWTTTSSVLCIAGATAAGKGHSTAVTIAAVVGTRVFGFTFDTPVLSKYDPVNGPTSGGGYQTLLGTNFGSVDHTPTALFQNGIEQQCYSTSWTSQTHVTCGTPSGYGSVTKTVLTVAAMVGTRMTGFTYDSPIVSDSNAVNMPNTQQGTITIKGLNFATVYATPTILIADTMCTTTAWTTATAVLCNSVATGSGSGNAIVTTLASLVGTGLGIFSYDTAAVTYLLSSNGVPSGSTSVTLNGINFGDSTATPTAILGSSSCSTLYWMSVTTTKCTLSPGTGNSLDSFLMIGAVASTFQNVFSYNSPVVSHV
jgi:hypothetical protein